MNNVMVRVLWPQQAGLEVGQWSAEYVSGVMPGDGGERTDCLEDLLKRASAAQSQGASLTVILPAELSLFERVQLPARNQRQALQALPFVVEELLATDIEDVHLAVGNKQADGAWPVLVLDLQLMKSLFALFEQCEVRPQALYVDAQLLSVAEGELCVLMCGDRVLLHSAVLSVALALDAAVEMLHLLTADSRYTRVSLQVEDGNERQALLAQQLSVEFSALDEVQTSLQTLDAAAIAARFQQFGNSAINLLQGVFHIKPLSVGRPWWQLVAAVLLFAVIGQTGLQVVSGWYFNRQALAMERMSEDIYRKLLPDARQVSNPRKRLQGRLNGDGAPASADSSFAYMFGSSVQAISSLSGLSIGQLRYEGKRGELQLEVKAQNIELLDSFKQAVDQAGLHAEISSANEGEAGIVGRIQIRTGA